MVSQIEVERKFLPTLSLKLQLGLSTAQEPDGHDQGSQTTNTQVTSASPLTFTRLPDQVVRDTYYDLDDQLSRKGVWIRWRQSWTPSGSSEAPAALSLRPATLEAKVRLGGDYADSQFHEIEGEEAVCSYLERHLQHIRLQDLVVTADLETHRRLWTVAARSSRPEPYGETEGQPLRSFATAAVVVIDEVTAEPLPGTRAGTGAFKHLVGEVEMTRDVSEVSDDDAEGGNGEARREAAREMDASIAGFMSRYAHLFSTSPKPQGKLSAYYEWKGRG